MLVRHERAPLAVRCPALVLAVTLLLAGSATAVDYPFADDMENTGSGNWTFESPWAYTAEASHSGSTCITDSPVKGDVA